MMGTIGLLLLLTSLQGASAQSSDPLARGRLLLQQKQYQRALQLFARFKQEHPRDSRPYFYSGMALFESGQLEPAGADLRRARELDPGRPEYTLLYAEVLSRLGRKLSAVRELARFDDEAWDSALSNKELKLLSDLYFRLGKPEQALSALESYAATASGDRLIDFRRGEILFQKGSYPEALKSFRRSLVSTADPAPVHYWIGLTLWKLGRFRESRQQLLAARRGRASNPEEVLYYLGLVSLDLQQPQDAISYLRLIESSGPRVPQIYNALARAYRRAGQMEKSREYLLRFRATQMPLDQEEIARQRADALVSPALEKLQDGRTGEAETLLLQAVGQDPDHWVANKYLAQIYLSRKNWASAYPYLMKMRQLRPRSFEIELFLSRYWYLRKDPGQALEHALRARASRPSEAGLRNLLGNIYLELGRRSEALAEYRAAVRLAPDREDFQANYESLLKKP